MRQEKLEFDAASVRILADSSDALRRVLLNKGFDALARQGGPGTSDPGRWRWVGANLKQLLAKAWDVDDTRIVGPDWLGRDTYYTVQATMPPNTSREQFQQMLQNLVIERFQLKLHHETRTYPGYQLTIAPGGPKLKASASPESGDLPFLHSWNGKVDADDCPVLEQARERAEAKTPSGGDCLRFQSFSMAEFVVDRSLTAAVPQPNGSPSHIVDKTGLTGRYDFSLRFDTSGDSRKVVVGPRVRESMPADDGVGSGLPNVFTAIQRELGLKLEKVSDIPVDVVVIDQGRPVPTDN
jgi:uncharacterized protein (TIGR03435 family)